MKTRGKIWKKGSALLMLVIMAVLLLNNAFYLHIHVLPDGSLISHAHPVNKTGENPSTGKHHHNNLELQLFQDLQLLFLTAVAAIFLLVPMKMHKRILPPVQHPVRTFYSLTPGRAPPLSR